uniref:Glycerol-3-phosphate dehydrogenase [NAD(+)] n=1 Tax=Drosophila rhopaloa TaxID=1041015 RepID=A0A6P4F4R0_DRORH
MEGKLKVCIIGAEGWGSAIAAAVSNNVLQGDFHSRVHIYVNDELIRNSVLSKVINSRHENVKYLPGIKLPKNLIAVSDLLEAAQNADILIFSTPQEFVKSYCNILAGNVKESAFAVSMTKGLMRVRGEDVGLVSHAISERLGIPCYSMMSAHSAMEMAQGKLCEATIGCSDDAHAKLLTSVLQTKNCRVISVNDVDGVELCGTLTDIIALGAGFVDGLRLGENARVTAIHLGIKEMMRFTKTFFPSAKMSTFYESCGVANSVASSYVDKNATFAKSFITSGKTIEEIEANLLHGRKILGPVVAADVNALLEKELMQKDFPLFTAIHLICQSEASPEIMLEALQNHPDLSNSSISHLLNHESARSEQNLDHVLDEVANTLPKLRTALDKVLAESGNESLKHLKVMEDWTEVNDYDVEDPSRRQVSFQDSSFGNDEMPRRLSLEAAKLHDDIRDGNMQVAFKMDINEGDRHVRLLLEEERETSSNNDDLVISSRLIAGQDGDNARMDQEKFLNSSAATDHTEKAFPTSIAMNDSHDVLDLSSESEPLHSSKNNIQLINDAKSKSGRLSEMPNLETAINEQEEANIKAQENLIKSIRQTIQALGDKEKMENLIAESQVQEESLQLKNQMEEKTSQLKNQMEEETSQLNHQMEEETSQLKNQMEEETSQLKNQMEEETYQLKNQMEEETSQLKNQMEEEISHMENQLENESSDMRSQIEEETFQPQSQMEHENSQLENQMDVETFELKNEADESHFVGSNAKEEQPLEEQTDNQQQKLRSEAENLKALMFKDTEEPLEAERLVEMRLQDEHDFDLDEEPVIGKEDRTYTKENMELQELLEWQKLKHRGEDHSYSSAELEDATAWEDTARLPVEHEDRLQDVDNHHDAELVQVRAENKDFSIPENEKMAKKVGKQKQPYQNLDEANMRYYSESKDGETGHHEWDWLMNNEKIGAEAEADERINESYTNERDETLSKSDQEKLENLNQQLKEALQHDIDVTSISQADESKESLPDEELDTEAAKRITQQPRNPTPTQIPPVPLPMPVPRKQTHIPEGTPQFQNQPGAVPQPSPQTKPPSPKEHKPPRTNTPVKFEHLDKVRQPEASAADQEAPLAETVFKTKPMAKEVSKTEPMDKEVTKIEPVAKDVSKAKPTEPAQPKKETPPAQQKRPISKRKQQGDFSVQPGDVKPVDRRQITQKTEKHRPNIENQKKQLEIMDKKISIMRKDRRVNYKGQDPFKGEPDRDSRLPMDTSLEQDRPGESQGLDHQRRKVVLTPPFNPPINPRMRVPRPPFDGRDHEFHTMTATSVGEHLVPAVRWPTMPKNLMQNRTSLVATIEMKHLSDLRSQVPEIPRPFLKIPSGVPRTPTLTKILCALQLGLLASYLARCKKD